MNVPQHSPDYFVPSMSWHPARAALALLGVMFSLAGWINGQTWAPIVFSLSLAALACVLWRWFGDAIAESERGLYGKRIDASYRWSMSGFIFSEVMFFSALFGALFYARAVVAPMLADFDHKLLWPEFSALWPNAGPAELTPPFEAMGPWPIPTINTALLLSSGATLTVAHHALRDGQRRAAIFWLAATVGLGFCFLCLQGYEYRHAYRELNLKLSSGVYGSIFFLLTGFHGFHVMLGVLMLTVVLMRLARGHFRPDHHFAFEGAAWYWHFVDVVWLGLYVVVYWL
ncbi:Cytochrome c oxidase polypeptide III [Candidatus Glomeribacter gigasporarum BEG34]|uniref:cytochrome-c oxidase n=1 Tax=Candidatus Glomeribacter gigasporarum BEG34 TaxID=1070319 RepID=G2J9S7_9BURK|nr:cytochrome c oxidase subunit 3 [Candidatus Glomeribacter gigasporarum]CCD29524.1 Cytochrome c oxidase polypeptide III [Candidatus Glomeribacter gigasporarum BEG34]